MANKTSYKNIEGLIPLQDNGGSFIGVKNNKLESKSFNDLIYSMNIHQIVPFSINGCSDNFIQPKGIIVNNNQIVITPMKVMDSTNTVEISLTETIIKTSDLFAEGNNQGCKDNSYTKWNRPNMSSENIPYGRCYQSQGTMASAPYLAMDGVGDSPLNNWLASTVNSTWIYTNPYPIVVESLYLHNTNVINRSRDIDIFINEDTNQLLVSNYFCSPDVYAINYINIPQENRKESNSIGILVKTAFAGTTVGFSEIEINAKTKYVQSDTIYNVFLIMNEDKTKVDVIISTDNIPSMPTSFENGFYAFIQQIKTHNIYNTFLPTQGYGLHFDTSTPLIITNAQNETQTINQLNDIEFNDTNLSDVILYNLYCTLQGQVYARTTKFYKNVPSLPTNPQNGDVAFLTSTSANGIAYEWNGEEWVIFNDVPLGEVYRLNNQTLSINQYPCNNNFYIQSIQNNLWKHEESLKLGFNYIIPHNLYMDDITDYKCDCILLCTQADAGYLPGETAMCPTLVFNTSNNVKNIHPYLTKDYIGLMLGTADINGVWVVHKTRGYAWACATNCWKLVFRIWK